ncbi:MAG: hypothetical protein WC438_03430 [Candidatus Pacearchaeota archaeon]
MSEKILLTENEEIQKLIEQLEAHFNKEVIFLIYDPRDEEGIKLQDEIFFEFIIERILKSNNLKECVLVLNGFGGDFKTALLCSSMLRNYLNYYICFIPSVIGSSLSYFVLQSNKLIIGKKSILTQIDPLIDHKGEQLRAIKNLSSLDDEIRKKSHEAFNYNLLILRKILKKKRILDKKCFSRRNSINSWELNRIIELFMGKQQHESGLTIEELKKLKINLVIESEEIVAIANKIINKCREELFHMDEYHRFMIQCSEGGYYFS